MTIELLKEEDIKNSKMLSKNSKMLSIEDVIEDENDLELVNKEDVVDKEIDKEIDNGIKVEIIDKNDVGREWNREGLYRKDIESGHYIEKWLGQIEDSEKEAERIEKTKESGKIDVRIREIRDNILRDQLKNKPDMTIYSRIRLIMLEYGVEVSIRHHFGAVLTMRKMDDNELEDRLKVIEKRKKRLAIYIEKYLHAVGKYGKPNIPMNEDIYCSRYLGEIIEDKLLDILTGSEHDKGLDIVSVNRWKGSTDRQSIDWIYKAKGRTKDGMRLKIKHISSCIRTKNDGRGWVGEVFQWWIKYNKDADIFVLTGWRDRESLDYPIYMWIIGKDEIVNDRRFYNRDTFAIGNSKRSLNKYSKYEVKLDDLHKNFEKRIQEIKNERLEKILRWYKTYFR